MPRRLHDLLEPWLNDGPGHLFCIDHDGAQHSYADLDRAARAAAEVLEGAGVGPGDRVVALAENSMTFAAYVMACSRLDAWIVPLNARAGTADLQAVLDSANPRAVVFTPEASTAARNHADSLGARDAGDLGCGRALLAPLPGGAPEACFDAPEDQVAALFYTSGTTGTPKGVMLTHRNLLFCAEASRQVRALTRDDLILSVLPGTHIFSFASALLGCLRAGAATRFMPRFDPAAVLAALAEGVSVMPAVPQMYALLLAHLEGQAGGRPAAPRLRHISAGGAPLDPDWKRRVEGIFGLTLHNGYGMTEAAPIIATTAVGRERVDISCGPVFEGMESRLEPPPGQDELADGVGELLVRGPNVMKGYYRNPQETARALTADGFLRTGDLVRIAEDGAVTIVGRCKELIIRSGFNVYPGEVEAALNTHPAVTQAAVVGRPADGNEEVLAFVQSPPGSGVGEAELKAYLAGRLAPYKQPARIVIADSLPVTASNKVMKHKLIDTFAEVLANPAAGQGAEP